MTLIDLLPAVVSIFGLAFFWFIGAIPAGIALQLPPLAAALTAWAAYVSGVLLILLAGVPLRRWLTRRFHLSLTPDPNRMIWKVWDRYGMVGLALLSPVTVGAQAGALIGLAMGVAPGRLMVGMALGALAWSMGIMLAAVLGLDLLT